MRVGLRTDSAVSVARTPATFAVAGDLTPLGTVDFRTFRTSFVYPIGYDTATKPSARSRALSDISSLASLARIVAAERTRPRLALSVRQVWFGWALVVFGWEIS